MRRRAVSLHAKLFSLYLWGRLSFTKEHKSCVFVQRVCVCVMDSLILCSDADQPAGYDGVKTLQH